MSTKGPIATTEYADKATLLAAAPELLAALQGLWSAADRLGDTAYSRLFYELQAAAIAIAKAGGRAHERAL